MSRRRFFPPFRCAVLLATFALPALVHGDDDTQRKEWAIKGPLKPSGGSYFATRVELEVPTFRQKDERWRNEPLGASRATLGTKGCAVAVAAMVLASYGFDVDPPRLNRFLHARSGYIPKSGLHWDAAARYEPGKLRKAYEGLPSYQLIDSNLAQGNPVIVRVWTKDGPHFVVIAGKEGFDYLALDPGSGSALGLYPLGKFRTQIETLRFYERL